MRSARTLPAVFFSFVLTIPIFAQQTATPTTQSSTQRDPQALAVLTASFKVMNGSYLTLANDASFQITAASGTSDQSADGPITLKAMGPKMWRMEADTPNGLSTFVVNGSNAASNLGTDQQSFLAFSVAEVGNWFVPAFSIIGEYADPTLSVSYVGLEGTMHHIQILRTSADPILQQILSPCDVFIDSATLLPVKLKYSLHPPADLGVRIPAQVDYSDYRLTSGVLLPYDVKFSIHQRLVTEYTVTNVSFNVGLSASDFAVK